MTFARSRVRTQALALLAALVVIWPLLVLAAASPSRVLAAGAVRLTVTGFADPTTAGVPHNFTVSALKSNGNVDSSYGGTVHLTSSDGQAVLPADTTLVNGTRTFTATLKTAGEQSITARDTLVATITGSQTAITVNPDVAASVVFHDTGFNGEPLDTKTKHADLQCLSPLHHDRPVRVFADVDGRAGPRSGPVRQPCPADPDRP
jgi:hypothetical protein